MKDIITKKQDHITIITINRPQVLNAFRAQTVAELTDALISVGDDPDTRVIILNSSIERAFTAGGDIKEEYELDEQSAYDFAAAGKKCTQAIEENPVPVICAVDGYALGGGLELILAADITVAAKTAKIGIPTINLAGIPGWGSTQRLPRIVGPACAADILLTGRILSAKECYDLHLVQYLTEKEEMMDKAMEIAATIADKAPIAVKIMRQALKEGMKIPMEDALELENKLFAECYRYEDRKEGMLAFLEKRPHREYHERDNI